MTRAIVNVSTDSWVIGQQRLRRKLAEFGETLISWADQLPKGCPPHRTAGFLGAPMHKTVPYAFKCYALQQAAEMGHETLLWCDSCIVPVKPLTALWGKIEADGLWFSDNGYSNDQWSAQFPYTFYPEMFPNLPIDEAIVANCGIRHVVATTFGVSLAHQKGRSFLAEYYRLASTTKAFCGPWQNSRAPSVHGRNTDRYSADCGPPEVLGSRHDQSVASVLCARLGIELTKPPEWFSYYGGEDERTVLVADGGMKL